jgi:2-polyprenyl-3-methyl-5-hydroxy-6-metoxy-1,4-benzoquinol methylase
MASIQDDRGYNQGFKASEALDIRTERRCDYIAKTSSVKEGGRILEIGCGTGQLSYLLATRTDASVIGSDLCKPFIESAHKTYSHPRLSYQVFDFNQKLTDSLPEIGRFDAVVGNGILHHLYHNLDEALSQIRSLVKPGGKIVFLEPNLFNPYVFLIFSFAPLRKLARLEPDEMAFTKNFIKTRLEKNGFTQVVVDYKDFLVPNTPRLFINSVIKVGDKLERHSAVNWLAQSLFISAQVD